MSVVVFSNRDAVFCSLLEAVFVRGGGGGMDRRDLRMSKLYLLQLR